MAKKIAIHWFRQDLRLTDNPALSKATQHENVLPIYIFDDENVGDFAMGSVSRWWLHHSLKALRASLSDKLSVYRGNPQTILDTILRRFDIEAVYWNRCYEPWRIDRDTPIKKRLKARGIAVYTFNGSLLWEPWEIKKNDGTPYKVFTPFYRRGCLNAQKPRFPLPKPENANYIYDQSEVGINALKLLPKIQWDKQLQPHWEIGEAGAIRGLKAFVAQGISCYKDGRDFPAKRCVSRLSPHLHFGEISP